MKMKGIAMTSLCNRTSKDKHGDLFSFFLARLKIFVDSRNYNLCVESVPETDFGMPGMTQIMARPAFRRIQHAGHVRKFGMPGMRDFAGYELLITRTQASRGLGEKVTEPQIMLTGHAKFCCVPISMQNHSGPPPLLPVSKSLTIGMEKILAC